MIATEGYASVTYHCEGCGMRITLMGHTEPPRHQFCTVCHFLCRHVLDDPAKFWDVYLHCRQNDRDPEYERQQLEVSRSAVRLRRTWARVTNGQ